MQSTAGNKVLMGAVATIILAVGSVIQGAATDTEIDLNRAVTDITIGLTVLGAAVKQNRGAPST